MSNSFSSWNVARRMYTGSASPPPVASIVAVGCAIALGPLLAQSPPQTRTVDVAVSRNVAAASCAAEDVSLGGTMHLVIQTSTDPNGRKQTSVLADLRRIEVKGKDSQAAYRLDNQRRDRQDFPCGPGERCLTDLLAPFTVVGPGPDDGAAGTVLVHLITDPRGGLTGNLVDSRFACGH